MRLIPGYLTCALWAIASIGAVAAKDKPQVPSELAASHGFVYVAFPRGGADIITIVPSGSGKPQRIDTPAPAVDLPGARGFGKWLPAGRYRVARWGGWTWRGGVEFEVMAGRVTDLGEFMPANVGGYQVVLVPVPHPEHAGSLVEAVKPIASVLSEPAPISAAVSTVSLPITIGQKSTGLGLVADLLMAYDRKVNRPSTLDALAATQDPQEFLRLLRQTTTPIQDEPARLADGTLLFPADLGTLRKRAPDGTWSSLSIDTLRSLSAVEHEDGRLLAGSDDGRIRESRDDGKTWSEVKALGRRESVIDIDSAGELRIVATIERIEVQAAPIGGSMVAVANNLAPARMRVYVSRRADFGDLQLSKEFDLKEEDQIGWMGARGQYVNGRYFILAGNQLHRLDLESGEWRAINPAPRISSHRVNSDTGVVTALWSSGAFSKLFVSSDHGDQWAQIGRPPYIISDVQMDAVDRGWASRWNMGAFSGTWETYAFIPAKNDWSKSGEAPFNCRMMRVAVDLPILCFDSGSRVFAFKEGKWEIEFAP